MDKPLALGRSDIELMEFYNFWQPYGGPSEYDVFINFGITRTEFYQRVETARRRRLSSRYRTDRER